MVELINSLWGLLGLEDSDSSPDPPDMNDDATAIAEPPHGWALGRKNGRESAKDAIEATQDWPLDQAMEPANAFQFERHAAPPILRGEGYTLGTDPRNGEPKRLLGEQRTHSYVLGKTGTGKSLSGESEIVLFDKEEKSFFRGSIGDFVHGELDVPRSATTWPVLGKYLAPSLSGDGELEWRPVMGAHVHRALENLCRLTLETGRQLRVTSDHSVLALSGAEVVPKRGNEIEEGDVLFLPSQLSVPGMSSAVVGGLELDSKLATLFGVYVADGNPHGRNAIEVSHKKDAVFFEMRRICDELGFDFHRYEGFGSVDVRSNGLGMLAEKYFGARAREKRIPQRILFSSPDVLKSFLRGYFSCDSSIEGDGKVLCTSSASEQLIDDLQLALNRLGIFANKEERIAKSQDWNEHETYWRLRLRGIKEVEKFRKTVGLIQENRNVKLAHGADSEKSSPKHKTLPLIRMVEKISEDLLISIHALSRRASLHENSLQKCVERGVLKKSTLEKVIEPLEERISILEELGQNVGLLETLSCLDEEGFVQELEKIGRGQLGLSYEEIGELSGASYATARRTLQGKTNGSAAFRIATAIASEAKEAGLEIPNPLCSLSGETLSDATNFILSFRKKLVADSPVSLGVEPQKLKKQDEIWPKTLAIAARTLLERFSKTDVESARERLKHLKRLLESEVVPVRVKDVEMVDSDGKFVYDLSVEGNENFLAEGVFVHNSTFLLSQMVQDVERGESVILLDPHGDLAKQFLSHIPQNRWEDIIYINPLTAKRWGKVIKINFLEHVPELGREVGKRAFMSAMKKIHPNAWGYRMESIMRYALNLIYANEEFPKLKNLLEAIGNRNGKRDDMLKSPKVDSETKDFWEEDYDDFRDFYKVAAQDKIYKLASERDLEPMTNTKRTSISFFEAMNKGKIIVIDIPEGLLSSSLTRYLGSLMLTRIYQAATARGNISESKRKPVYLYIDEAHRFMTEIVQDNMTTLRKFGVCVTGASQNLQEYGERMESEVTELADTIIAFKCGEDTARGIAASFPTLGEGGTKEAWNTIVNLPYYIFYTSTPVGRVTEVRIAETVDLGWGSADWEEVAKASLDKYGKATEERKKKKGKLSIPPVQRPTPIKYFTLSTLAEEWEKRKESKPPEESDSVDWRLSKDHLYDKMEERYGFGGSDVYDAGISLENGNYIKSKQIPKDADGSKANVDRKYFWIAPRGIQEEIYPEIGGKRSGGYDHTAMICQLIKRYRQSNCYPMPTTESVEEIQSDTMKYYPDLLVYPPYRKSDGSYSLKSWDTTSVFAVEAEAFPTGSRKKDVEEGRAKGTGSHLDRTVKHFERMRDALEIPVVFAVRNEHDAQKVEEVLEDAGANIRDGEPAEMEPGDAKVILVDSSLPPDNELQKQVQKSVQRVKERSPSEKKGSTGKEKERSSETEREEVRQLEVEPPEIKEEQSLRPEGKKAEGGKEGKRTGVSKVKVEDAERKVDWETLVKKYKQRRRSSQPPEKLAEVLFELKEKGCTFRADRQKNDTYLKVRKYEGNERKVKSALSINGDVEDALEMVQIEI